LSTIIIIIIITIMSRDIPFGKVRHGNTAWLLPFNTVISGSVTTNLDRFCIRFSWERQTNKHCRVSTFTQRTWIITFYYRGVYSISDQYEQRDNKHRSTCAIHTSPPMKTTTKWTSTARRKSLLAI
jgi:hypothetical protein